MRLRFLFLLGLVILFTCETQSKQLPILSYTVNDQGVKSYYQITYSNFINQHNEEFKTPNDKVYIANFFFTRCPSICPPMRYQLTNLADSFSSENFMIISHTIDPNYDTPAVLKTYAESTGIDHKKWQFLNGSEENTKAQANQFKTNFRPNEEGTDFYHSSFVALVDRENRIRGFYDLLVPREVDLLKRDIQLLLD